VNTGGWLCLALLAATPAATGEGLSAPKPLRLETPVVVDGVAQAVIVVPVGDGRLAALAARLTTRFREATGAELPVRPADEPGQYLATPPATHLIALGNMSDNGLLRALYYRFYTLVDRWYPGVGGYVLHTVHDPWGNGGNVIVLVPLGGSNYPQCVRVAHALPPTCSN
jgi:hypothetical protein